MKTFVFLALVAVAIIWGTTAGALRQSPQEHLTTDDIAADWAITETGAAPGWSITPAHVRMW
jgi:hypothetical protein